MKRIGGIMAGSEWGHSIGDMIISIPKDISLPENEK